MRGLAGITARQEGAVGAEAVNATKRKAQSTQNTTGQGRAVGHEQGSQASFQKFMVTTRTQKITRYIRHTSANVCSSGRQKHGVVGELQQALDLAKANIEALVGIHPNPGGGVAIHQSAEKKSQYLNG